MPNRSLLREFVRSLIETRLIAEADERSDALVHAISFFYPSKSPGEIGKLAGPKMQELRSIMDDYELGVLDLWIDDFEALLESAIRHDSDAGYADNLTALLMCYGIVGGDYNNLTRILGIVVSSLDRVLEEGLGAAGKLISRFDARLIDDAVKFTEKMLNVNERNFEKLGKTIGEESWSPSRFQAPKLDVDSAGGIIVSSAKIPYTLALQQALESFSPIPRKKIGGELATDLADAGVLIDDVKISDLEALMKQINDPNDSAYSAADELIASHKAQIKDLVSEASFLREVAQGAIARQGFVASRAPARYASSIPDVSLPSMKTIKSVAVGSAGGVGSYSLLAGIVDLLSQPETRSSTLVTDTTIDAMKGAAMQLANEINDLDENGAHRGAVDTLETIAS